MSLAFVFPGQGSQTPGMALQLVSDFPEVAEIFGQASEILGYDLLDLVNNGPASELNNTEKTQPALLTTSYAIWHIWQQKKGVQPMLMAGHSLGEYTALVCSGALPFQEAVSLVADRGRYMQAAVPEGEGAMAAILGLDTEKVIEICEQVSNGKQVSVANFNSIGQEVIAGHTEAVKMAVKAADDAGAMRSIILPVSVPSHCILMQDAARQLADRLTRIPFSMSNTPVLHNIDANIRETPESMKKALVSQLYLPVRWVETIQAMSQQGITRIIECGPGRVLCGLIRRIDRKISTLPVYDAASIDKALSD